MKNKMQVILPDVESKLKKPYEMGEFMEELNTLVKSIIDFLEIQTKRTDDDYDLVSEINRQAQRYKIAKERYDKLVENTPKLKEKKEQAEEAEAKLSELEKIITDKGTEYDDIKNRIEGYKELIKEIDIKHNANLEIYKTHLEANDMIFAKMNNYNAINPKDDVQKMSNEISIKLKEFDDLLVSFINVRDKLAVHELDEPWVKKIRR